MTFKPKCDSILNEIRDSSKLNMIEIITTSLFVLSSIYGGTTNNIDVSKSTTTAPSVSVRTEGTNVRIPTQQELENKAKEYFKKEPVLVEVARCESSFRHLDEKGEILRGKVNKGDLGLMQINEYYHNDKAVELGLDLKTLEGNMAYAKYLYDKQGLKPWKASSKCWSANLAKIEYPSNNDHLALNK